MVFWPLASCVSFTNVPAMLKTLRLAPLAKGLFTVSVSLAGFGLQKEVSVTFGGSSLPMSEMYEEYQIPG